MMNILESISEQILTFTPDGERALDGETLAGESARARNCESFPRALRRGLEMLEPRDVLLVCGSFKTVAPALKYFNRKVLSEH